MSDQRVGIAEPGAPTAYIDNHATTNDAAQTVLQQKVRAPMVETLLSALINSSVTGARGERHGRRPARFSRPGARLR
jgi:hypothetical protein